MAEEGPQELVLRPKQAPPDEQPETKFDGDEALSNNANGAEHEDEEAGEHGVVTSNPADLPATKKKKKKRKTRPQGQRGLGKPTGMEEFYADAPMTPEQYEEIKALYDPDLLFLDRILVAIQRFERTRKLTPERRDVFYKWLCFGGIVVGSNMLGGGQVREDMDKDQVAAALSQVSVPDDVREELETTDSDSPKYAIDFMGCMRAFLSRSAFDIFGFETKDRVELVTTTLERFMDYLMQHGVCPEYQQEVLNTRNFCREATLELWSMAEAQRWLPGEFNIACSTLFGGNYGRDYDGETYWADQREGEAVFVGLTPDKASQIVGFGIAGAASNDEYQKYCELTEAGGAEALDVVKVIEDSGFEITGIENPTADCKDLYTENSVEFRPLGRITAKPWQDPEAPPEDLTEDEKKAVKQASSETYVFFIEEIILQHLSVGQKVQATIRQLNCGIWFFDEFIRIYPDFELYILNEIVQGYKEPKMIEGALGWEGMEEPDEDKTNGHEAADDTPKDHHIMGVSNTETGVDAEQINRENQLEHGKEVEAGDDQEPY